MKFIGIDFGWVSGASGLCCLQWQNQQLDIVEIDIQTELEDVLAWLDRLVSAQESAIVAVDAPTLIPNQIGTRVPDRLSHKYFGKYHAGCYPANLNRPFAERTVGFGKSLEKRGFAHAANITPQKLGRYQIEVFPHPAIVHLFDLDRILKYKKGKLSDKKRELKRLRSYIVELLPKLTPVLNVDSPVVIPKIANQFTGRQLKVVEDRLDAIICAYTAAYWWYWGQSNDKNIVLGDETTGYIVVPNRVVLPQKDGIL